MGNKSYAHLGWTIGGLGALLWMPVLAIVLFAKGNLPGGLAGVAFFLIGGCYLFVFAPWKHADVSLGLIYLGLPVIIIAGAISIFLLWYPWQSAQEQLPDFSWYLLLPMLSPLLILFLPALILGKKTWNKIHNPS